MEKIEPLAPGTAFGRYVTSLVQAGNVRAAAASVAERWSDTPAVRLTLEKAQVSVQSSENLAEYGLANEFFQLYRAESLVARLFDRMRRVPFLSTVATETSGASLDWIPEEGSKVLRALTWSTVRLPIYKAGGIVVVSRELTRQSTPSAVAAVNRILVSAAARFVDSRFLSDDAAVVGESPAGVANGAAVVASSPPDLANDLVGGVAALGSYLGPAWIGHPAVVARIAAAGLLEYPGPLLLNFPVFVSPWGPTDRILLVDLPSVYVADEGQTNVSISEQAMVLMDDGLSPASDVEVSLWQANLAALRVERWVSWVRAHADAVVAVLA